jgi:uncharacterized membrane protein YhhN
MHAPPGKHHKRNDGLTDHDQLCTTMDPRKSLLLNLGLYILLLAGTIAGEMSGLRWMVYGCKPLLMVVLGSWFFFNSRRMGDRFTLLIQAGLFFSLLGDVALMVQHLDEFNFLIGLGAFFLAQLCYTLAFGDHVLQGGGGQGLLMGVLLAMGIATYAVIFALELVPRVDDALRPAVGLYALAICSMGVLAALRHGRTYPQSFWMVFVGAVLFIASDSLLAINRFVQPLDHAAWSVMLTYGAAQVLIAAGALRHVLTPDEVRRRAALNT